VQRGILSELYLRKNENGQYWFGKCVSAAWRYFKQWNTLIVW